MQKILLLIFSLFLFSCSMNNSADDDILPKEDLIDILYEMHFLDALKDVENSMHANSTFYKKEVYDKYIFDKYGINKKIFIKNVVYYSNMKEIDDMYARVIERLGRQKGELVQHKKK